MTTSPDRGRFLWFDLITTNPSAAIDFYSAVVGWKTQQWGGESTHTEPYTMLVASEKPIGGVVELNEEQRSMGVPTHWVGHISTPDVDATAKRITELGGKVWHGPVDIPTVGRFAIVSDPQGAIFSIYNPAKPVEERAGTPAFGEFAWHELMTSDREKAFAFYQELFGWEEQNRMDMGEMGIYQIYGRNGVMLGGMFNTKACQNGDVRPLWVYYAFVEDLDACTKRVTEHGGKILNGPMPVPGGGRIVQCQDPQGGMFALHSMT